MYKLAHSVNAVYIMGGASVREGRGAYILTLKHRELHQHLLHTYTGITLVALKFHDIRNCHRLQKNNSLRGRLSGGSKYQTTVKETSTAWIV